VLEIYRWLRRRVSRPAAFQLTGDYASWDQARSASTGYDADVILEKTKTALLKVKNGEAVYERDSVLFDQIQYSWPLLAGLMWAAARSNGRLNVLDFGGSLGSTYFQNRAFLKGLRELQWNIVEQTHYVEVGRTDFQDDVLRFYSTIDECVAENQPNVVVLSSVLQYIENPYVLLMNLSCYNIIIDRTPFWDGSKDRLCVQHVPPNIYPASYPCWIFSRPEFLSRLRKQGYKTIVEFPSAATCLGR
jgi:putative methyltransferase (TIGR04325 family)